MVALMVAALPGDLELEDGGLEAGPGGEGGEREVDAAVFVAAGGEVADGGEGEGAAGRR